MQAAFRLLEENPCNDEAVFAALALVAKAKGEDALREVEARRYELWKAMDGRVFFKRLLLNAASASLCLNFLSLFCMQAKCRAEIISSFGEELIQACMEAVDMEAKRDGIECCAGLLSCSGTSMFLLSDSVLQSHDGKLCALALRAFASTNDPFLFREDVQRAVFLLGNPPINAGFAPVALGLANRLENGTPKFAAKEEALLLQVLTNRARTRGNNAEDRRALLVLSSAVLLFFAPSRSALPRGLLLSLAVLANVELHVGLERISSALMTTQDDDHTWKADELRTLHASVGILDRVRCWLLLGADGDGEEDDEEDSGLIRALLSSLDSSCFFLSQVGAATGLEANRELVQALTELCCGVLFLFWRDDPSGPGVTQSSKHLPAALLAMARFNLEYMLPVLARLDAGYLNQFLGPLSGGELEREFLRQLRAKQWSLACFAGLLLLCFDLDGMDLASHKQLVMECGNAMERLCLRGLLLLLSKSDGDKQSNLDKFMAETSKVFDAMEEKDDEEDAFLLGDDWPRRVQLLDLRRVRLAAALELRG